MSAELKVVLVDDGQTAEQIVNEPRQDAPPAGPPAPRPSSTPATPEQSPQPQATPGEAPSPDAQGEAFEVATSTTMDAIRAIANSLGAGGMLTGVMNVTSALRELYAAADRAAGGMQDGSTGATPQTSSAPTSSPAATPDQGPSLPSADLPEIPKAKQPRAPKAGTPTAPPVAVPKPPPVPPPVAGAGAAAGAGASAGTTAGVGAAAGAGGATAGTGALAGLAAAAGPAAIAVAGVAVAAAGTVIALKMMHDAFKSEAERLEGLSPEISNAQARSDLRAEMADMRRAQQVGPQLGGFTDDMSRLQTAMSDIWTQVLKVLLDIYETFRPLIEVGIKSLEIIAATLEITYEQGAATIDLMQGNFEAARKHEDNILKASEKLARILTEEAEDEDPMNDPFLQMFLGGANGGALRRGVMPRDMGGPAPMGV